ncbi:alpha/beta fold hydrolase [Geodermatophilus sp. SYSU D00691]
MRELTVTSGDVPLHVVDPGGTGTAVVLLHGGARTSEDWEVAADRLVALGHRPVAIDLRGHGRTPVAPWTWDAVVADVEAVVGELRLERPAVVGHSLGGIVAALWATGHPECPLAVNLDGHGNPTHRDQYAGLAPDDPSVDALVTWLAEAATLLLGEHMADVMRAIDELDVLAVYRRARCPLLLTRAGESMAELVPAEAQPAWVAYERWTDQQLAALAAELPEVDVVITPTGHFAHVEAPELLVNLVHERLELVS